MPSVSVIIPVYNTEKYLERCLDSVCNQTLSDIEIICINDCSIDNSLQILQKYANKDNRIKIIDFTENKGVAVARNTGIDTATGEYIGFIDSDDFINPDFYEQLYNKAKENGTEVVKGNIYTYDIINCKAELSAFYDINDNITKNTKAFLYGFTSAIYSTKFIKNNKIVFPEGISHFEDPYFSINVTIFSKHIDIVNDAKYFYVQHPESTCANCKKDSKALDFAKSVMLIFDKINSIKDMSTSDYLLYVSFLIDQATPWCSDLELSENANMYLINAISYIYDKSRFSISELLYSYFMYLKTSKQRILNKDRANLLSKIRNKLNKG